MVAYADVVISNCLIKPLNRNMKLAAKQGMALEKGLLSKYEAISRGG